MGTSEGKGRPRWNLPAFGCASVSVEKKKIRTQCRKNESVLIDPISFTIPERKSCAGIAQTHLLAAHSPNALGVSLNRTGRHAHHTHCGETGAQIWATIRCSVVKAHPLSGYYPHPCRRFRTGSWLVVDNRCEWCLPEPRQSFLANHKGKKLGTV